MEARAVLKSIKRLALTRFGHDLRRLHLCDNLGVVLSFERIRLKNFKLLRILREFSAYCLARNIFVGVRWIPSELNISDEPSRMYDPDDSKLLVDLVMMVVNSFLKSPPNSMSPKRVRRLTAPTSHASTAPKQQQQQQQPLRKRTLSLEGSGQDVQSTKRLKSLDGSSYLQERLVDAVVVGKLLPGTEQELRSMEENKIVKRKEIDESESASTSSEFQEDRKGGRKRSLQNRQRRRLQNIVNTQLDPGSSLLEMAAVSTRVRESYSKRLEEVMSFFDKENVNFAVDRQVDAALVKLFNLRYQGGEGSYVGDYMLAALMDKYPDFNKTGSRQIPRAWRSLKGWRKLCPSHSRLAYPLAVWCGISWRMVEKGRVQKAVFNLLQVLTYSRPGALLKLRRMGLARPTSGVTSCWSMITSLTETGDISKTGSKDDSILLDSEWLRFLGPILESMSRGPCVEVRLQPVHHGFQGVLPRVEGGPGAVSSKALGAKHRQGCQKQRFGRSQKEEWLGDSSVGDEIRESWKTSCNMAEVGAVHSSGLQVGGAISSRDSTRPQLPRHFPASMTNKGEYVADFFAGSGRVSRAIRKAGFSARE